MSKKDTPGICAGKKPSNVPPGQRAESRPEFTTVVCTTGRHKSMLEQVMRAFRVPADYDLSIMKQGQTLFDVTQSNLEKLPGAGQRARRMWSLVHTRYSLTFPRPWPAPAYPRGACGGRPEQYA